MFKYMPTRKSSLLPVLGVHLHVSAQVHCLIEISVSPLPVNPHVSSHLCHLVARHLPQVQDIWGSNLAFPGQISSVKGLINARSGRHGVSVRRLGEIASLIYIVIIFSTFLVWQLLKQIHSQVTWLVAVTLPSQTTK